jgi:universal stress protein E
MAAPLTPAGATAADAAAVPIPRIDEKTLKAARERHGQCLDSLLAEYDIRRDCVHMTEGAPADAIEDVIDERGIDVVVAGAVSRSWLQRLLIGSTAEMLFDAIGCDLIVVKEAAPVDDD